MYKEKKINKNIKKKERKKENERKEDERKISVVRN